MSLKRFCYQPVFTVSPGDTVLKACQLFEKHNIGCLIVQDKGRICGILTDRDVALKVAGEQRDALDTKVADAMTREPVCIPVDKDLHELTRLMGEHHVRRVPVVDSEENLVGIVTLDDLISVIGSEMFDVGKAVSGTLPSGFSQARAS
jgi:CBS domain-containing protein